MIYWRLGSHSWNAAASGRTGTRSGAAFLAALLFCNGVPVLAVEAVDMCKSSSMLRSD